MVNVVVNVYLFLHEGKECTLILLVEIQFSVLQSGKHIDLAVAKTSLIFLMIIRTVFTSRLCNDFHPVATQGREFNLMMSIVILFYYYFFLNVHWLLFFCALLLGLRGL